MNCVDVIYNTNRNAAALIKQVIWIENYHSVHLKNNEIDKIFCETIPKINFKV